MKGGIDCNVLLVGEAGTRCPEVHVLLFLVLWVKYIYSTDIIRNQVNKFA